MRGESEKVFVFLCHMSVMIRQKLRWSWVVNNYQQLTKNFTMDKISQKLTKIIQKLQWSWVVNNYQQLTKILRWIDRSKITKNYQKLFDMLLVEGAAVVAGGGGVDVER